MTQRDTHLHCARTAPRTQSRLPAQRYARLPLVPADQMHPILPSHSSHRRDRERRHTFLAVKTPTSGAMNSGFSPLSMSGGMMVSVIADAASYSISGAHCNSLDHRTVVCRDKLTGTMTLVLMLYFAPSRASVRVKPTRPTFIISCRFVQSKMLCKACMKVYSLLAAE